MGNKIIKKFQLQSPKKILLIAVPGIGDTLLATPLIATLQSEYPKASFDMLVREGTEGIINKCLGINKVITFNHKEKISSYSKVICKIFRKYDLAISISTSDRYAIYSFFAAPYRISVLNPFKLQDFWKRLIYTAYTEADFKTHTIIQNLRLTSLLGIKPKYEVLIPEKTSNKTTRPYAVLHMIPGSNYKNWSKDYWLDVIGFLEDKGLQIFCTGSPDDYPLLQELTSGTTAQVPNFSFEETTSLLKNAALFVGVDTATAHLAAATGTPTLVLFGPSNSTIWAPWPKGYNKDTPPFTNKPGQQQNCNVTIIKADCKCFPFKRTCQQHNVPESLCLTQLTPETVILALNSLIK